MILKSISKYRLKFIAVIYYLFIYLFYTYKTFQQKSTLFLDKKKAKLKKK